MPRFAANLTTMYPEFEVPDRFEQARLDGFRAIELLFPYNLGANELAHALESTGLEYLLLNTPLGDAPAGERGLGAMPGREREFREGFEASLDYARRLGVSLVHVMAGVVPAGASPAECEATLIDNLRKVAPEAASAGITLLLEPLNFEDTPGYLYATSDAAVRIIEAAGLDNLKLQFDFYHLQITEGNLAAGLRRHLDAIGHLQFSSVPGRHEPQHGEVNLPYLFNVVDETGYGGWIGCEYRPKASTAEGLTWAHPYGLGLRDD